MLILHFKYQTYFKVFKKKKVIVAFFLVILSLFFLEIECLYLATVSYKLVIVTCTSSEVTSHSLFLLFFFLTAWIIFLAIASLYFLILSFLRIARLCLKFYIYISLILGLCLTILTFVQKSQNCEKKVTIPFFSCRNKFH